MNLKLKKKSVIGSKWGRLQEQGEEGVGEAGYFPEIPVKAKPAVWQRGVSFLKFSGVHPRVR